MATQEQIDNITSLYVGYFNRAPDPAGLQFWIDQLDNGREFVTIASDFANSLEAKLLYPFLDNPDVASPSVFITSVYTNLFNRAPDAAGLQFWTDVINSGSVAPGDMVEAIINGAQDTTLNGVVYNDKTIVANKNVCAAEYVEMAANTSGFVYDIDAANAARGAIAGVDATQASIDTAKQATQNYFANQAGNAGTDVHVLTQEVITTTLPDSTPTKTVVYWGYNPHAHGEDGVDNNDGNDPNGNDNNLTNEGPQDGGITAEAFFSNYLPMIAGQEFAQIDKLDPDSDQFPDFGNVRDITLTPATDGTGGTLNLTFSDGSADDIALGKAYYDFLSSLIFDSEGNSRFFEKEVAYQVPLRDGNGEVIVDADNNPILVDYVIKGGTSYTFVPVVLTQNQNNNNTMLPGFTSEANDKVVAGTLDMLHGAYIDGGLGDNVLEIDAKGYYAQPKALLNFQTISIENLPNVYTTRDSKGNIINVYPDLVEAGAADEDSIIDLSRATEMTKLLLTEGDFYGLGYNAQPGDITVTGVRNGAETTLDGAFTQNVRVNYSGVSQSTGVDLVLHNVNLQGSLDIAHNSPTLNLESVGAGNYLVSGNLASNYSEGGHLRTLNITGNAHLEIVGDMNATFSNNTAVTIDASANTGGVDLKLSGSEEVTFKGTDAKDEFVVVTSSQSMLGGTPNYTDDQKVVIEGGEGNDRFNINTYDLTATSGDGNVNYEMTAIKADLTLGDGHNHVQAMSVHFDLDAGDGNNRIDLAAFDSPGSSLPAGIDDYATTVNIKAGDGANTVRVAAVPYTLGSGSSDNGHFLDAAEINIELGNGGNKVLVPAAPINLDEVNADDVLSNVTVVTGNGDDEIFVGASDLNISSGGGDDEITILGIDADYVTDAKTFEALNNGAMITINTGSGNARINLGNYDGENPEYNGLTNGTITAKEGSSITGSNIELFVNTTADLRAASLTGVTKVVLDDDNARYQGQGQNYQHPDASTMAPSTLTLLDSQVSALGASAFSVQGSTFGATANLAIVITGDVVLSNLLTLSELGDGVKLCLIVRDGASLTLTAEELHTYVAPNGIDVAEYNGYSDNQVIVTDAGLDFDPYDQQNGGKGGGTIVDNGVDVDVIRTTDGYERPKETPSTDTITIDSDVTPVVADDISSEFATTLKIVGSADLDIQGEVDLGNNFVVDFSTFAGDFIPTNADGVEVAMTITNFQDITEDSDPAEWGHIKGNGTSADPVRINIEVADQSTTGDTAYGVTRGGFVSSGVQQYIVTDILDVNGDPNSQAVADAATIVVCDQTKDLEVLGLQNNRAADLTFEQVNWGTTILLEGDGYANASDQEKNLGNPDLSEVGCVTVNFFEAGANAEVRVTNQGTELGMNEDAEDGFDPNGERKLDVAGIIVNNADRLALNVEDGDAVIRDVSGADLERIIVTGPEDVTVYIGGIAELSEGITATKGTGLDTSDLKSIDATGVAGTFTLALTGDADLSGVTLTGVEAIMISDDMKLTLNADQAEALQSLISDDDSNTELCIVDMNGQAIDMASIDVSDVVEVVFEDVDGTITVNAATNFGDADELVITAEDSDTNVQMTLAQFETTEDGTVIGEEDGTNEAKLTLTDIAADSEIDLSNVGTSGDNVDVDIVVDGLTVTEDFLISGNNGLNNHAEDVRILVSGATDLTEGELGTTDCIVLEDGAELTLTHEQVANLISGVPAAIQIKLADGATSAKLNIADVDGSLAALDLNALVADNPGLDIGTLTLIDDNNTHTLTGWTMGEADEIVTPTKDLNDPVDGIEPTTLNLTVEQFLQLAGAGLISGDGLVNLTDLANNNDSDADYVLDNALLDTSGITAQKGTITFKEEGANPTAVGETVTLNDASDISGFEIILTDGQLIRFATQAQADGAKITEDLVDPANPTGVAWLFTAVTSPVDTSNYDANLNTLFVHEDLVNGANEEDLWTSLASGINVEKYNDAAPKGLVVYTRINTFEPFGSALNGITFDDQGEFQTTGALILNLEGNVTIGDVTIDDTVGDAAFEEITINSYFDEENVPSTVGTGYIIQPNKVGDIYLNAGVATGETVTVNLLTHDDFNDLPIANGTTGAGSGPDLDDGLDLEVGTIHLGTPAAGENTAEINVEGDHDVSIGGIDMSDAALTQVTVNVDELLDSGADVSIAGVDLGDLATNMNITDAGVGDDGQLDAVVYIQDLVADANTDFNTDDDVSGNAEIILNISGNNDLKEMGDTDADFSVDGIYAATSGTLTLTADQLANIFASTVDNDNDGAADNWVLGPGVNPGDVTVNICDIDASHGFDLNLIQQAGFNIGTITVASNAGAFALNPNATLGGADLIEINLDNANVQLEMTAEQFNGFSGVINEVRTGAAVTDANIKATIVVDELEDLEDNQTHPAEVTINFSQVNTTGDNTVFISASDGTTVADVDEVTAGAQAGDHDVFLSAATDLGNFSVSLWDVDSTTTPDELAGDTIRFATVAQADGRQVIVLGDDGTDAERDTNVVWLFDTVTGTPGLDVSGYDANLARIWIREDLVDNMGGNVDDLFTVDDNGTPDFTLSPTITKRIEATDLTEKLGPTVGISQTVEITAFVDTNGQEYEIDDPLVHLENLTLVMGGVTDIGDLELDNLLGPVNPGNPNFPGDDEFNTLTITSYLANSNSHYLLPDEFNPSLHALPSDTVQFPDNSNNIGDISSGADRGVMRDIVINLGTGVVGDVDEGTDLNIREVMFSDDGDTTAVGGTLGDPLATLDINGANDVTFKSLDTSDAEITAISIDTVGHTGTMTVTGGSPAFYGGATTTTMTIDNNSGTTGVVQFGGTWIAGDDPETTAIDESVGGTSSGFFQETTVGGTPQAGIDGEALTDIITDDHGGTVHLGVIAQIDSEDFTLDNENGAGVGRVTLTLGEAETETAGVVAPTLSATGIWTFDGGNSATSIVMDMKNGVTYNAGGTLNLFGTDVRVLGDNVDLTALDTGLNVANNSTITVMEGAVLTLTVAQVLELQGDGVIITGLGTVKVEGNADNVIGGMLGQPLQTVNVDFSGITLTDADETPAAGDEVFQIDLFGAFGEDGNDYVQNVIAAPVNSLVNTSNGAGALAGQQETITGTAGDDTIIADPLNDSLINVDAGTDVIVDVTGDDTGAGADDTIVVNTGATAVVDTLISGGGYVATADTRNDGVASITNDSTTGQTIDMSAAGGNNGWSIIGGSAAAGDNLIGSDQDDTINGGNDTVTAGDNPDTLTGGDGADVFEFNIALSTPTAPTTAQTTAPEDEEEITITADGVDDPDDSLIITYQLNGIATAITVSDPAINFADANAVAAAVAAALNGVNGITATSSAAVVTVDGDAGNSVAILGVNTGGTAITTLAGAPANGTDVAQVSTVTIPAGLSTGEVYKVALQLAEGQVIGAEYTVASGDTPASVASGLALALSTAAPAGTINVAAAGSDVTITDVNADNGGFTITNASGTPAVISTGASLFGAATHAEADIITDFVSGTDKIDLGFSVAGSANNYVEAADSGTYAAALANAGAAFDGTVQYYFTTATTDVAGEGLLFFDADGNQTVDGVVKLTGLDETGFDFADIIG